MRQRNWWVVAGWLVLAGLAVSGGFALTPYFNGNRTLNPALLEVGGFTIYWYGLIMAVATLAAFLWWQRRATSKLGDIHTVSLAAWLILFGLIGARLMFVLLKWPEFRELPWWEALNLHSGGLSIHGALLFGIVTTVAYAHRYRLPTLALFDLLIPPVVVGQIIGRLGNFFNQEAFGGPTDLPWKMWVAPESRPVGLEQLEFFHPTFLYSMVGLALVLLVVWWAEHRFNQPGTVLLTYLIAYSAERFVIEFFRIDSDVWYGLTIAQWASLFIIMIAPIIGLIWKRNKPKPR